MDEETLGNIPLIDLPFPSKGWFYCQETDEIYYSDGKPLIELLLTREEG